MTEQMHIPLTQGFTAVVDATDYERVMCAGPWHAFARTTRNAVYARRTIYHPGPRYTGEFLHTFLTGWALIDHRNGDGLDNRRQNLREATTQQNNVNQGLRRDNTSGYKGVTFNESKGCWRARIGSTRRHLGYFDTPEEAACAYDIAAVELFGEFARPNFVGATR